MANPILIQPADQAMFLADEFIPFQWETELCGPAPEKLDLYIGRDSAKPYEDPGVIVRRWLLRPATVLTSYNETAYNLGLHPGETYYWQVARDKLGYGMLLSEVRSFKIKPLAAAVPAGFAMRLYHPARILLGAPVRIELILDNKSREPVRLTYSTRAKFAVEIYHTRGILSDKYVWPPPSAQAQVISQADLKPGTALTETIVWDQRDLRGSPVFSGTYRLAAFSLAAEYRTRADGRFVING
jgi:hypothetical protein